MSKIKVGDTVRVVGKAVCGTGQMEELIEIGTVCEVVSVIEEDVELIPKAKMCVWNAGFFYPISSVEKGREIWLSDNRRRKIRERKVHRRKAIMATILTISIAVISLVAGKFDAECAALDAAARPGSEIAAEISK